MKKFNIGTAVSLLKESKVVSRIEWKTVEGIRLIDGEFVFTYTGCRYVLTNEDILAEDWIEVNIKLSNNG